MFCSQELFSYMDDVSGVFEALFLKPSSFRLTKDKCLSKLFLVCLSGLVEQKSRSCYRMLFGLGHPSLVAGKRPAFFYGDNLIKIEKEMAWDQHSMLRCFSLVSRSRGKGVLGVVWVRGLEREGMCAGSLNPLVLY